MSEQVITEQTDVSHLPGSPGQKRKRDSNSPSLQRAKRAAPQANMGVTSGDTAAYIESAIQATEAAAASGVNVADFNALQQATQEGNDTPADPASATSTAQAALGMYPTLHVPPSTEEQFAAQAAAEAAEHQAHENALNPELAQQQGVPHPQGPGSPTDGMMDDQSHQQMQQAQQMPPNGVIRFMGASANAKPTVGSEEWHKMRKDNHKEGRSSMFGDRVVVWRC